MLINGQLTDFDVSAGVGVVALLGVALFEYAFRLSRKTLPDERVAVGIVWAREARKAATVEQAIARSKSSVRRASYRSAGWGCGERVSARRIPCEDST
jgi:hypothetical protein